MQPMLMILDFLQISMQAEAPGEKARWEWCKDVTCGFKQILEAVT